MTLRIASLLVLALVLGACDCSEDVGSGRDSGGGDGGGDTGLVDSSGRDTSGGGDTGGGDGGDECDPPDMLIVLDRTMSMHRQPDGNPAPAGDLARSKWAIAVTSIEAFTAALDTTVRFGLELFPRLPAPGQCVTLAQRIAGTTASNDRCEAGEVLVPPNVGTSADIALAIDVETTELCRSTPIGAGLDTALTGLMAVTVPDRPQYVVLITDGQDTCENPLPNVDALAAAGIGTYVIGFDASGTGVDRPTLNDAACAGGTAPDPATNCTTDGMGRTRAANPSGPDLFLAAGDAAALTESLEQAAGDVCCGCLI